MNKYSDGNIIITSDSLIIRDGLAPKVGVLSINIEEISSVEIIELSPFQRLTLYGTNNLKTLYAFDLKRIFKSKAVKVSVKESLGPFSEFVINPSGLNQVYDLLVELIQEKEAKVQSDSQREI